MTNPSPTISDIDGELRLVVHEQHAYVVDRAGQKVSKNQFRNPADDEKTWHIRAKLWARQVASFISPAN